MASPEGLDWLRSRGIRPLPPAFAVDAMETATVQGNTQTVCVDADWTIFRELAETQRARPILEYLGRKEPDEGGSERAETGLVRELREARPKDRADMLKAIMRRELSKVLGRPEAALADTTGFFDLGMDSLMAVEFRNALKRRLGCKLPATLVMDHPDIEVMAAHILEHVLELGHKTDAPVTATPSLPDVAVAAEADVEDLSADEVAAALEDELREVLGDE